MDFALGPDQRMIQQSVSGALDRVCGLDRVRAFAAGDRSVARDVWAALTELGVAGLLIAEAHGGQGLGLLDAALVCEALGAHVAPAPFLGSAILAPLAISRAGSPAQKSAWLPRLAAGEVLAGIAIGEGVSGGRDGAGVTAHARRLSGKALFVIDAADADLLIVADLCGGLHLVEAGAPGLERIDLATIDPTRRLGEAPFDNTPAEPLAASGYDGALAAMRNAGWTMLAADMLGASQTLLDKAVAHAKQRRQFGRQIGAFQAVKHLCAEMAAELAPCRALVWYAAQAGDAVPGDFPLAAAHAKAHLSEVSRFIARTATEVHGGVGFTDLLGLHYWFKRVGLDRQLLGGPERVRHLAAEFQGLA